LLFREIGDALRTHELIPATQQGAPSVFCIVVNWNGWADTSACLTSLVQQDYPSLHILVVDNGSTDDSVARIRAEFPRASLILTGRNLGFPSGCDVGIRHAVAAGADYIWMLNNDTIAPPDTCSRLVAKALADPSAGIIGSVLYYMHDPAQVQSWGGGEINALLGRSTHALEPFTPGPHSYMTFASALIPRQIFEQVGILYEGFFMYWDDTDLALRVTRAGYSMAVAEDTAILHKEGGSSERRSPLIDRFSVASGLHFLRRHSPVPAFSMVFFLTTKLTSRVLQGHWKNARAVLLAIGDYRRQRGKIFRDTL
jgi:GT2 family glycosyltransferase